VKAEVRVGQKWRSNLGGPPETVIAVDDKFGYVKSSDSPKYQLANPAGGRPIALSEFAEWWRLIEDAPA
jgi:hypothetical protein